MKVQSFLGLLILASTAASQKPLSILHVPRQPYFKFVIPDSQTDSLTFYLSEFDREKKLPLVVFVQGSGNQSLFISRANSIKPNFGHTDIPYLFQGKAKVLIVEKPGVQYLEAESGNTDFNKFFSLDSWSETLMKSITYILRNENVDGSRILVIGHSEGGVAAAHLANRNPRIISNVAILAGEGPSQLFSLYEFAKDSTFFNREGFSAADRVDSLERVWKAILAEPGSVTRFFWGFTYLRWSSFLKTSVLEELAGYNGKIFIAQGNADKNVYPVSAEVLYTMLFSKGKNVRFQMVANADHSFSINNDPKRNGWEEILKTVSDWFFDFRSR